MALTPGTRLGPYEIVCALGAERADDAYAAMRTAVELDPDFWLGWADIGILQATRGEHLEAMRCAEKALA